MRSDEMILFEEVAELAGSRHRHHNVAAPNKLASNVKLRESGPLSGSV